MSKPVLTLTAGQPFYAPASCKFTQQITFRSPDVIPRQAMQQVTMEALDLYRRVLDMNGLTDHKWPPDEVALDAYADGKGGVFQFVTRAQKPKPIIIN